MGLIGRFTNRGPWHHVLSVLILLVAPAGFYLESGDFNVLEAPGTFGLPPQWGPTVPSAYPAMDSFLELHGGISDSRFLVLPFPGPGGGSEFGPFAINTFGLAEYEGATSVSNLFVGPLSSDYSTTVLNYLIQNRTDRIGVLLGQASVRYVLVDLQANFTGPPQWNEGSLIGSPTRRSLTSLERNVTWKMCSIPVSSSPSSTSTTDRLSRPLQA